MFLVSCHLLAFYDEIDVCHLIQIDVSVNAPVSGTITELLAEEDSTVTVGQDLLKIEPGEGGAQSSESKPQAKSEPKNAEEGNKDEAAPAAKKEKGAGEETLAKHEEKAPKLDKSEAEKPAPKKEKSVPKQEPQPEKTAGSRNETRVSFTNSKKSLADLFCLTLRLRCPECDRLLPNVSRRPKMRPLPLLPSTKLICRPLWNSGNSTRMAS